MTRPLSVDEVTKILGHRPSLTELREFREAASRRGEIRTNRRDTTPTNPYVKPLAECNPHSYDPRERRRYERLKRLHDEKEVLLADARKAEALKLRMQEDEDVQKAQSHFRRVLETFDAQSPEDVADMGDATTALQEVMAGDKDKLFNYYDAAQRLCDRRTGVTREETDEARKADADTTVERNRLEMELWKAEAASLQPPHPQGEQPRASRAHRFLAGAYQLHSGDSLTAAAADAIAHSVAGDATIVPRSSVVRAGARKPCSRILSRDRAILTRGGL